MQKLHWGSTEDSDTAATDNALLSLLPDDVPPPAPVKRHNLLWVSLFINSLHALSRLDRVV